MSNFRKIVREHNATYYDYDTNKRQSVLRRYLLVAFASGALVVVFSAISGETLGALLTVQSILIGFSFSVMFFLMSGSVTTSEKTGSIEADLKVEKLNKLSRELFYNVSYFNVVAIFSVFLSLLMLLPDPDTGSFLAWTDGQAYLNFWTQAEWQETFKTIGGFLTPLLEFLFFASLVESLSTFARTVGRVSFYFERRLKIENG